MLWHCRAGLMKMRPMILIRDLLLTGCIMIWMVVYVGGVLYTNIWYDDLDNSNNNTIYISIWKCNVVCRHTAMTGVGGYFTVQSSGWAPVKGTCGWLRGSIQGGAFSLHSFVSLMYVDLYFASILHCQSVHSPWWDGGLIMSFWKRVHNQHRYLVSVVSYLARTVSIFVAFQDHFRKNNVSEAPI